MSNTDSFIDEVTQEVRRDRLFAGLRKYGWIAILVVVLIVGGAAWREYQKARDRAASQALGDAIAAALEQDAPEDRVAALETIDAPQPGGQAIVAMLIAAEQVGADREAAAVQTLEEVANANEVPLIYRQIASFKALIRSDGALSVDERRAGFEALNSAGSGLRLLAAEQLALLDIETGDTDAALARLRDILADGEVTAGLRRRASQLIVALGGDLDAA